MLHAHRIALLRVLALAMALSVLPFVAGTANASSPYAANCSINLRSRPTTNAAVRRVVAIDTTVTVAGTVSGGSWGADCGTHVSGHSWFKVTAIGGRSVRSLLGVSVVYAATGLFRGAGVNYGVDISHWNGSINFAKVRAAGKRFVIAKASEGSGHVDAAYARNKRGAMDNSLKFTGYHYARPSGGTRDAVAEANHFVSVLGFRRGMLAPVLDLEVTGGLGQSALRSWVKAFVERVHARLGIKPIIYTSSSFWRDRMGNTSWFASHGYRVWVAHWGVSAPRVPGANWGDRGWALWQYSSCGHVDGISGCVDLDKINVSLASITY
jgi:GH25 family lysozyme M1 (1,4-beta-N-acetylmuramidase)